MQRRAPSILFTFLLATLSSGLAVAAVVNFDPVPGKKTDEPTPDFFAPSLSAVPTDEGAAVTIQSGAEPVPRPFDSALEAMSGSGTGAADPLRKEVETLILQEKWPEALEALQRLKLERPKQSFRRAELWLLVKMGRLDQALRLVQSPDRTGGGVTPQELEPVAFALLSAERFEEAFSLYQRLARGSPENMLARRRVAWLALRMGRPAVAIQWLDAVLAEPDPPAWALNLAGLVQTRLGQFDHAAALHRGATQSDPQQAESWNLLGSALAGAGNLPEAVQAYQTAVELDPWLADAYASLGGVLAQQGEFSAAMQALGSALDLDLSHRLAWTNLMGLLDQMASERPESEGLRALHQERRAKPNDVDVYRRLLDAWSGQVGLYPGLVFYRAAHSLQPAQVDGLVPMRHWLATRAGATDLDTLAARLERQAARQPDLGVHQAHLAIVEELRGHLAAAIEHMRRAAELDPGLPAWKLEIARLLYQAKRSDDALDELGEVLLQQPELPEAHLRCALILSRIPMASPATLQRARDHAVAAARYSKFRSAKINEFLKALLIVLGDENPARTMEQLQRATP